MRATPYRNSYFTVELDGMLLGGFSQISGLSAETEVEAIREGGVNYTVYQLVGQTSYPEITLSHGLAQGNMLFPWYQSVLEGDVIKHSATIYLLDEISEPVMWWEIVQAWPKSWKGPSFDAKTADIAIEELVIVHEGISETFG